MSKVTMGPFKVEYEYSGSNLDLELKNQAERFIVFTRQWGASKNGVLDVPVIYKASVSALELDKLANVLLERKPGVHKISNQLSVVRGTDKYAMIELKYSMALETVFLTREAADKVLSHLSVPRNS